MSRSTATKVAVGTASGIPFSSLLTLLFIALKLTGVIAWSWWWVLSPTLIAFAIGGIVCGGILMICLVCLVVAFIVAILE